MLFRNIRKIWRPAIYQGDTKKREYFEGWYYKFSDKAEKHIWALIPGVSFDKEGKNPHCFIQFIDDSSVLSRYFSFNINKFSYSLDRPEIRIAENLFSPARIEIDIEDQSVSIKGVLNFKDIKPWPVSFCSPGAMGWYAFVPFMECYHGVLSFDHLIEGQLTLNGQQIDFSGGRGYIEKDWGKSFPSYHIWIQSNHFSMPGTSLMVSVASIPWMRKSFDGFLIGFWHEGHFYRFATYSGARITDFYYDREKLLLNVQSKCYRLEIGVNYRKGADLRVPVLGEMRGRLSESLSAEVKVSFFHVSRGRESLEFFSTGRHAGLEIEGEIPTRLNL